MSSHRELCVLAAKWLLTQPWCDIACYELRYNKGFVDAVGISRPRGTQRVTVIEVKKNRTDLLQDINAGKYLKYEPGSTHCYLAGTTEALMLHKRSETQILEDLKQRGFPDYWGILVFESSGIRCLKSARAHGEVQTMRTRALTRKIAKSLIYRALQGKL